MDPPERIRQLCKKIASKNFEAPGVFTNAMEWRPEITKLVRDVLPSERGLYRVTKASGVSSSVLRNSKKRRGDANDDSAFVNLRPERIDGKYILSDEIGQKEDSIAFKASRLTPIGFSSDSSLPLHTPTTSISKLISQSIRESEDVDSICDEILRIAALYEGLEGASEMKAQAMAFKQEYSQLAHEIEVLEQIIAEQKGHLNHHEEADPYLSPTRGSSKLTSPFSVAELIEQEKNIIKDLENQLSGDTEIYPYLTFRKMN